MKYGLKQETINQLQTIFMQYPELEKVILYGSRSQGNYKQGSDIDLAFFGKALTQHHLFWIDEHIETLHLPYMLDLSLFEQLENPQLQHQILKFGEIVYQNTEFSK